MSELSVSDTEKSYGKKNGAKRQNYFYFTLCKVISPKYLYLIIHIE